MPFVDLLREVPARPIDTPAGMAVTEGALGAPAELSNHTLILVGAATVALVVVATLAGSLVWRRRHSLYAAIVRRFGRLLRSGRRFRLASTKALTRFRSDIEREAQD